MQEDQDVGFRQFRRLFFDALERRCLDDCQALLNALADVAARLTTPPLQWEHAYHQAILFSERRQFDRAEALLRDLLSRDPSLYQRARALLTLGIQLNEQGQWSQAEDCFYLAQTAYTELGDDLGQAKAHNNIGIAITVPVEQGLVQSHRLAQAVKSHQTALEILSRLPPDAPNAWEVTFETARNWHGLGMAFGLMGEHAQALEALQTHVGLCEALDDLGDQAIGLADVAVLAYAPLGRQEEAYAALDKAIGLFQAIDDPLFLAEALARSRQPDGCCRSNRRSLPRLRGGGGPGRDHSRPADRAHGPSRLSSNGRVYLQRAGDALPPTRPIRPRVHRRRASALRASWPIFWPAARPDHIEISRRIS